MEVKNMFLSKTNWLNVITFIIGFLALGEFGEVIPPSWTKYVLLAVAGLNLVIRNFFTSKPTTEFAAERSK